jgi:hypothetical protein
MLCLEELQIRIKYLLIHSVCAMTRQKMQISLKMSRVEKSSSTLNKFESIILVSLDKFEQIFIYSRYR